MLEFGASATRFEVDISIMDDSVSEVSEQFFARLTLVVTGTDVQLSPDEATIEITDDDGMLQNNTTVDHYMSHQFIALFPRSPHCDSNFYILYLFQMRKFLFSWRFQIRGLMSFRGR